MCHVPRAPNKEFVGGARENMVHMDKASGTSQAVAPPWRQKARDKETRDKRATYSVTDKSDRHWAEKMRVLHGVDLKPCLVIIQHSSNTEEMALFGG